MCLIILLVSKLEQWCKSSSLLVNTGKTKRKKELLINQADPLISLVLCDQTVEMVSCFKYQGTHIDGKFSLTNKVDFIYKKASQRQFLIRRLKGFGAVAACQ